MTVRQQVIDLIADCDGNRSSPLDLVYRHLDGQRYTDDEIRLVASATTEEQQAALAVVDARGKAISDLIRIGQLPARERDPAIEELVASSSGAQLGELEKLMDRCQPGWRDK